MPSADQAIDQGFIKGVGVLVVCEEINVKIKQGKINMTADEIEQRLGNQEKRIARLENAVIQMSAMQRILYDILGNQDRIIQRQEEAIAELRASHEQSRRRHEETDQWFNILLEEVRFLIRQQGAEGSS